jgi:hypothetical protein
MTLPLPPDPRGDRSQPLPLHLRDPYLRKVYELMPFTYPERVGDYPDNLFEPNEQTAVLLNQLYEAAKKHMRKHGGELPMYSYLFCRRHPVSEDPAGRGLYVSHWKDNNDDDLAKIERPEYKDALVMFTRGMACAGQARAVAFMSNVWVAAVTAEEYERARVDENMRPSKQKNRREATMLMYESEATRPCSFACWVSRFGPRGRGVVLGDMMELGKGPGHLLSSDSRFATILPQYVREAVERGEMVER